MSVRPAGHPARSAAAVAPPDAPLRLGFVLEHVLGHASWAESLRAGMDGIDGVETHWARTDLYKEGGLLERGRLLPSAVAASARARLDMRAGLRGFDADVLFFNTQKPAYFCQWELLRTPSILMTDVTPRQYDRMARLYGHAPDGDGVLARAKHLTNVLNFHLAAAAAPWSTWTARSLIDEYGVPPERVHVIPPGVDTRWWRPTPGRTIGAKVRLLFVGGNFERKGGALLLDVFRRERLHERAELHIVTRDPVDAPDAVVHRDMRNNSPELLALYQQADVFVLPTQADCFSIASIEAMAAGLPVITTAIGGIPDIVQHGRTGFLVAPGDSRVLAAALRAVVDDAAARERFGRAGRERAESQYDARLIARRIVDLAGRLHDERRRQTIRRYHRPPFRLRRADR